MSLYLLSVNEKKIILIPEEAIRIRVIANSNSESDIKIKEELSKDFNNKVEKILNNVKSLEEARDIIKNNYDLLTNYVEKKLNEINYSGNFKIKYGMNYFPEKIFHDVKYKEGYYESLVVTLGEGKGPNYWCVLYPPLCNINENKNIEYKFYVKEILNKYLKT